MKIYPIRPNNFDLIRLIAATQVVLHHGVEYMGLPSGDAASRLISTLVLYFPGVPVFFFISGFLISRSYESSKSTWLYAENRLLRIYPALIVCTIASVIAVHAVGYLPRPDASAVKILTWMAAQTSIVQFYNPEFMRGFGVGVLNGSLWTIAVELQFYVLTPMLYWILPKSRKARLYTLATLTIVFCLINLGYWALRPEEQPSQAIKLLGVSFLPWFYMFLCGILAQQNFDQIKWLFQGKAMPVAAAYIALVYIGRTHFGLASSNDISPLLYIPLAWLILSLAYSRTQTSEQLIRSNDISYGVYIYHMPIINLLIYLKLNQHVAMLWAMAGAAFLLAMCSWYFVEKPCLSLKRSAKRRTV